jgi:hypothetical protein
MLETRLRSGAVRRHDSRMSGRRWLYVALAALTAAAGAEVAVAAEGSALRGLRPPGQIDFAPLGAARSGFDWQPAADPRLPLAAQSPMAPGLRSRLPGLGMAASEPARLSYSYSDSLTAVVEAGAASDDPYAVAGQVVRSFRGGLGVGLGLRQRQAGSNVVAFAVEQGWGPFRGGYTVYSGLGDVSSSPAHRFALSFDYGKRSSIGLSYTAGRDLQTGMLPYAPAGESRDWTLSGHHWLTPQWALTYDVINSDQATYRRQGLRFGIRHTF